MLIKRILVCIVISVFAMCHVLLIEAKPLGADGLIAFTQEKKKGNYSQICVIDTRTNKILQLTTKGANHWPRWSPDGQKIIFASHTRAEHNNREIYIMDADGKNERRLTYTQGGNSSNPRWGSNNYEVYFESAVGGNVRENIIDLRNNTLWSTQEGDVDLGLVKIKDMHGYFIELKKKNKAELDKLIKDTEKQIEEKQEMLARLSNRFSLLPSPDGKYQIIYYPAIHKIELLEIATGKRIVIKDKEASGPAWSKNSKKIAFAYSTISDHKLLIFDLSEKTFGAIEFPKTGDQVCNGASWSRNGKYISFTCATPFSEIDNAWIYILDLETKKAAKFVQGDSADWY